MKQKVLMTGAFGKVGSVVLDHLRDRYEWTLTDRVDPPGTCDLPFVKLDLTRLDGVCSACKGMDTVLHLAANPSTQATWDEVLPANLIATHNVFEGACRAACRRVVFFSSANAILGYPKSTEVRTDMPVRPANLYGASKVCGEALGRYFSEQRNISVLCIRPGWIVTPYNKHIRQRNQDLDIAVTYRDLIGFTRAALDAPMDLRFGIFHALSNNRKKRMDISDTVKILGYQPVDDVFQIAESKSQGS